MCVLFKLCVIWNKYLDNVVNSLKYLRKFPIFHKNRIKKIIIFFVIFENLIDFYFYFEGISNFGVKHLLLKIEEID